MIAGTLRVHPGNPRYFQEPDGRAVLLTGSHTWNVLQDAGTTCPPRPFDYVRWLDWLVAKGHRFFRMWTWEGATDIGWHDGRYYFAPLPYQRCGDGLALDGFPRFDLRAWDDRYFSRLRERVGMARDRGIYVAVMLFQGWSVERKLPESYGRDPWLGHPFHRANNVNGIDGDPADVGNGLATQTLAIPEVLAIQRAYVDKVVESVGMFPNVLYEVENEGSATADNDAWQDAVVGWVREADAAAGHDVHPVLRTNQWPSPASDRALFATPAEAVSPTSPAIQGFGLDDWCLDPPPATGDKVIILDTDHLWGTGGNADWVWRAVLRGHNPVFMDPWEWEFSSRDPLFGVDTRDAMGAARHLFDRFDIASFTPRPDISSTRFALADDGLRHVIAWTPNADHATLDLRSGSPERWDVEWMHPTSGLGHMAGSASRGFTRITSPFHGPGVILLSASE